jgi:2-polyprenyl-3-methyl-5-hydroxy-6-metoxy-1,4-benzoquinol methylase
MAEESLGEDEIAIADYKRVLEMGGPKLGPRANLAALYLKLGRWEEAERVIETLRKGGHQAVLRAFGEKDNPIQPLRRRLFGTRFQREAMRVGKRLARDPRFQRVLCNLCNGNRFEGKAVSSGSGWPVVRCTNCGLLQVNPQPTQELLKEKYQEGYYSDLELSVIANRGPRDLLSDDRLLMSRPDMDWLEECGLSTFEKSRKRRRLLDVGCGSGLQLSDFSKRGWDCEGTEVSKPSLQALRAAGFTIRHGILHDMQLDPGSYDLVVLHHVIEHLTDPLEEIKRIHSLLQPGGWLFIVTPGADSIPSELTGEYWFYDPDHTFFFSRKTLLALLEKGGFAIVADSSFVGTDLETTDKVWLEEGFGATFSKRIVEVNQGDVLRVLARKAM